MNRADLLRQCLPDTICLNPIGENAGLFKTSMMTEEFFEKYYNKMLGYVKYCEKQRFLVNNNLFFGNMVIMENGVGFLDWDRMAVTDWILDFACMDLHRPYFRIPEKLYAYLREKGIEVEH